MIFVPCKRILAFQFIDFFNYKLFNYFFTIDHAISFLASMRSYSNVNSILSNVALKVLSLATLGFINLNTCTKNGINTCQSYSLVICNVISFPTYWMNNPNLLNFESNIIANMLWILHCWKYTINKRNGFKTIITYFGMFCHKIYSSTSKSYFSL